MLDIMSMSFFISAYGFNFTMGPVEGKATIQVTAEGSNC